MPDDSTYTKLQIDNQIDENNIDEDLEEYFGDDDQELEAYSLECVYGPEDTEDYDWQTVGEVAHASPIPHTCAL